MADDAIRTCRACGVDVSVPLDMPAARCPRCAGPLSEPDQAGGDAPDRTLLSVDPRAASASRPTAGSQTRRDVEDSRPPTDEESAPTLIEAPPSGSSNTPLYEDTSTFGRLERHHPAQPTPTPGQRLGEYELRRVLGKGGMGVVFEAYQPKLERTVALKLMTAGDEGDEELERFEREARAAAKLKHPRIVPIHDVGEDGGRRYFTMDLVVGQTLTKRARAGDLSPVESARIVAQVAEAIQYAHGKQIIHRDLKPSNIILDEQGQPHVTDFGLAKDLADVSGLTLTGVAMGSPPYMPPEQARGEFSEVDEVSDVYGLGAILYECLVGRPPFTGKSLYDVIAKVLVDDPEPPRKTNPAVPVDLETICLKALEKEKWRRYPSATAMALDLQRFCAGQSIHAARRSLTMRVGRLVSRHRGLIVAWLVPLLVTLSLVAQGLSGGDRPREDASDSRPPRSRARDPIAQVAHDLGDRLERAALDGALELIEPHTLPDATGALAALSALPPAPRHDLERRVPNTGRLTPTVFETLVRALAESRQVDDAALESVLETWLANVDAGTARLVTRVVLAYRGSDQRRVETFARALDGPSSVVDLAVMRGAANHLQHLFSGRPHPRATAIAAVTSDTSRMVRALGAWPSLEAEGVVVGRRSDGAVWQFPPLFPDSERKVIYRYLYAREESKRWLDPTRPLLTASGQQVLVGWLRFVFLLDAETGRVLARARVPGLVEELAYRADGSFLLTVWDLYRDAPRDVIVRLGAGRLDVQTADGGPLPAVDLLPKSSVVAIDDQRRLALSVLHELDDLLVLEAPPSPLSPPVVVAARRLDLPAGHRPRVGFDQTNDGALLLGHRIGDVQRDADGPVIAQVFGNRPPDRLDWLDSVIYPQALHVDSLTLILRAGGEGGPRLIYRNRDAFPPLTDAELEAITARAYQVLAVSEAPNPWIPALAACALTETARRAKRRPPAEAEALALRAARAGQLLPFERVDIGCLLDAYGWEDAADEAFTRALERLHLEFGYVPEWAGQGELDPSALLSTRIAASRLEGRGERAESLRAWRARFAPRIGDPEHRGALRGLALPDLLEVDQALKVDLAYSRIVLLVLLFMLLRHRRQQHRDLARLGEIRFWDRLSLYWREPLKRLSFALPCYVTRHERTALLVLYVLYFGAISVQDAHYEVLTAVRTAPQAPLAGIPDDATVAALDEAFAVAPRDRELAYARAWVRHAAGRDHVREAYRDVLALGRDAPALLGLAELLADKGELDRARELLDEAAQLDPELIEVPLLRARLDAHAGELARLEALAQTPRVRLCLEATGELPSPLAPPPPRTVRDRALLGEPWWQRLPALFARNLAMPVPGSLDASIHAFEKAWVTRSLDGRRGSQAFWAFSVMVALLFLSLLAPALRPLEPTAIERQPVGAARLLAPFWPGVAQVTSIRPVRGAVMLACLWHLLGALAFHPTQLTYALSLRGDQIAAFAGVDPSALAPAVAAHKSKLWVALAVLYVLHWVDLAHLRRTLARGDGAPLHDDSSLMVIPLDSLSRDSLAGGSSPLSRTGAARSGDRDAGPGLFDSTAAALENDPEAATELDASPPTPDEG